MPLDGASLRADEGEEEDEDEIARRRAHARMRQKASQALPQSFDNFACSCAGKGRTRGERGSRAGCQGSRSRQSRSGEGISTLDSMLCRRIGTEFTVLLVAQESEYETDSDEEVQAKPLFKPVFVSK